MRICVFCGSSAGKRPDYMEAARAFGHLLATRGIGLVYGGASVGMMGAVADAALAAGGEVIGVIPRALVDREIAHKGLTDLRVVESMHERKALMAELSNGFVSLPGGTGTLEEAFEVWTWGVLGFHKKACAWLNVAGYYDALMAAIDRMASEGFLKEEHRHMVLVDSDADKLVTQIANYTPPQMKSKWE
ncbi:TIGR00730 family Rossman fold protein [Pendulispora albinea]|uniref:Cytokinin riboside 5'-monophosphate phosphoribohydrolase n=1 Tax=Pendulispora albinea TaxID=2741071 RepID=A0ABZ2M978_9BACT